MVDTIFCDEIRHFVTPDVVARRKLRHQQAEELASRVNQSAQLLRVALRKSTRGSLPSNYGGPRLRHDNSWCEVW